MNRRGFLKGLAAGAAALGVPLFDQVEAQSAVGELPKRLVIFFTGNGTVREQWLPSGSETNFTLGPIMKALTPFKEQLLILDGLDNKAGFDGSGGSHEKCTNSLLTGRKTLPGPFHEGSGWADGISVDQEIAKHLGIESLELGVDPKDKVASGRISFNGSEQPRDPWADPVAAFDSIFGNLTQDPGEVEKTRALKKSVLDFVNDDLKRLQSRLPASAKPELEAHLDAIRGVEQKLATTVALGGACDPIRGKSIKGLHTDDNVPMIGEAMMDLMAMAIACDTTRVASLMWNGGGNHSTMKWLGFSEGFHPITHEAGSDARTKVAKISTWYAEQFAYLLTKLSQIPEGTGTLLDNCVVLWCNPMQNGYKHDRTKLPLVIAGGGAGALKTGRFLTYPEGTPHNRLLVSLCQMFGVQTETFGDPKHGSGALTNLG